MTGPADILTTAQAAMEAASSAVQANPSPANLDALAKASREVAELRRSLELEEVRTFAKALHVHEYLEQAGFRLSQSAFYQHTKEGHLKPRADGLFHMADIKRYIGAMDIPRLDGTRPSDASEEALARQVKEADLRAKRARAEREELNLLERQGELVPREALTREVVARAQVFRKDLTNYARAAAPKLCGVVEGDAKKIPQLVALLEKDFANLLDRYTSRIEHKVEMPAQ